jgi:hypothetical protein
LAIIRVFLLSPNQDDCEKPAATSEDRVEVDVKLPARSWAAILGFKLARHLPPIRYHALV